MLCLTDLNAILLDPIFSMPAYTWTSSYHTPLISFLVFSLLQMHIMVVLIAIPCTFYLYSATLQYISSNCFGWTSCSPLPILSWATIMIALLHVFLSCATNIRVSSDHSALCPPFRSDPSSRYFPFHLRCCHLFSCILTLILITPSYQQINTGISTENFAVVLNST